MTSGARRGASESSLNAQVNISAGASTGVEHFAQYGTTGTMVKSKTHFRLPGALSGWGASPDGTDGWAVTYGLGEVEVG